MTQRSLIPVTDDLLRSWPLPSLAGSEGKEDRGRVSVIGGSSRVPGGVVLAALAVLRAGAGKLHIGTAASAQPGVAVAVLEAKVSPVIEDRAGNLWRIRSTILSELTRADSILVGPGMESCAASARVLAQLIRGGDCPFVVDAGALAEFKVSARPKSGWVITPHFGEMAGLLGVPIEEVQRNPLGLALDLARETGAVVALKSPVTYIANEDGDSWVHRDGSVGLGTSGSGDVLAGLVAGLIARGASLSQAAVWGVRLHGRAGEILSKRLGPVGFLAREILPEIPGLLAKTNADKAAPE